MSSPSNILIVDDDSRGRETLEAVLTGLGHNLHFCDNGLDALKQASILQPDLILLDVMMPRMSGFEVCRKIKQDSALRDTVIIMVTALNEVGDFERAVECGCDDFLTKPVNKLELITRVRSLLRVRLLKRRVEALLKNPRL